MSELSRQRLLAEVIRKPVGGLSEHDVTQRAIIKSVEIGQINHDATQAAIAELLKQQRELHALLIAQQTRRNETKKYER
ncbi:hypothetical protein [Thiocystis violascens]|uniref:Uncharacterized protein n=1 Tax=Thiocystis violascens (strain ATCC 17096 / DSM 198 / 6111) TaxID=765911 RepID=I3YHD0_THIV6|nr:hypothetical protein [Thiocystis violascens]AFL76398.1 hypothetical protein Thivi_4607 [Thiocystis violascens DSM 198]